MIRVTQSGDTEIETKSLWSTQVIPVQVRVTTTYLFS